MGYLGVKLYPPFGYHPAPGSLYNSGDVSAALDEVYDYCETNEIPVTVHCSRGGAYNPQLLKCRELIACLAHPSNWAPVLKRYKQLYLNLAHFGGDLHNYREQTSWAAAIERLMMDHDHVYADLAYNDMALSMDTAVRYFGNLLELAGKDTVKDRILLGTDWPASRHTWTEKAYLSPFITNLPQPILVRIGFQNPMQFLFHDKGLPTRIGSFLNSRSSISQAPAPTGMGAGGGAAGHHSIRRKSHEPW
jgi:predicted TIM-barrel fold metal-dependent hydrolase